MTHEFDLPRPARERSPAAASPEQLVELVERVFVRNEQLERALRSRILIEQAKGMLAERFRLSIDDAFALLRQASRSERIRIRALATAVVCSEKTPPEIEGYKSAFAGSLQTKIVQEKQDELTVLRRHPVAQVCQQREVTIVVLVGEIDLYNAEAVREALRKASDNPTRTIVVDLSSVDFIDSTTIGILLEVRDRLHDCGLLTAGPPPAVRRAIELCGLEGRLPIYRTLAEALSHVPRDDSGYGSQPRLRLPGAMNS